MESTINVWKITSGELLGLKKIQEGKNEDQSWDKNWWNGLLLESGSGSPEYETKIKIVNSEKLSSVLLQNLTKPEETLCDLHIFLEGNMCVPVHRAVLRGKSAFLDCLLKYGYQEHIPGERGISTITLTDVEVRHVIPVIHLLYTGEAIVSIEDERGMLDVLKMLQLENRLKIEKKLFTPPLAGNASNSGINDSEELQEDGIVTQTLGTVGQSHSTQVEVDSAPSQLFPSPPTSDPRTPLMSMDETIIATLEEETTSIVGRNVIDVSPGPSSAFAYSAQLQVSTPRRENGRRVSKKRRLISTGKKDIVSVSSISEIKTASSLQLRSRYPAKNHGKSLPTRTRRSGSPYRFKKSSQSCTSIKGQGPISKYEKDDDFVPLEDSSTSSEEEACLDMPNSRRLRPPPPPDFFHEESDVGSTISALEGVTSPANPECPFCPLKFSSLSSLDLHLQSHPSCGKDIRGYFKLSERLCKVCNVPFKDLHFPRFLYHVVICVQKEKKKN